MRERLLEATVACLHQNGYAGTSTNDVVRRAGVSRGALLHHFPSRLDLLLAAAAHASERTIEAFRKGLSAIDNEADRMAELRELLWTGFTGPTFDALLELAVASRTEPQLNRRLREIAEHYQLVIVEMARALFPALAADDAQFEANQAALFFMLQGIALSRVVQPDDARAALALDHFVAILSGRRR